MHYTYSISIFPKDKRDQRSFWFQNGEVTDKPDFSKNASSYRGFRTKNKLETFLRGLDKNYPDVVVRVLEIRPDGRWQYSIPMGENLKEYIGE